MILRGTNVCFYIAGSSNELEAGHGVKTDHIFCKGINYIKQNIHNHQFLFGVLTGVFGGTDKFSKIRKRFFS